jgi:hypothetical protein
VGQLSDRPEEPVVVTHIDRRAGSPAREKPKMSGHEGETISEYFDFVAYPEKMVKKVTRAELLAVLDRWHRVQREQRFFSRLWRWLKAARGTKQVIAEVPKAEEEKPE